VTAAAVTPDQAQPHRSLSVLTRVAASTRVLLE